MNSYGGGHKSRAVYYGALTVYGNSEHQGIEFEGLDSLLHG